MSDLYDKVKEDVSFRQPWAETFSVMSDAARTL
jgi:hypothetical protein